MNAEQFLNEALGGNMNIGTLKPLAWHEIMEQYAQHKIVEALKPSHNSAIVPCLHTSVDVNMGMVMCKECNRVING